MQLDKNWILPCIILLEGFVSIATEILTIRQLLPVAGGSVLVTSLVIGIFLLFLALGYHHGGKQIGNLYARLRKNFLIAALWLGIGLSYLFVAVFFYEIQKILGQHVLYPLIAYLLLITAPLIFVLGQTVPITMNMIRQTQSLGRIGGNTLALSTVGSFFGALFSTLVLMFFLGVAWTVFLNALVLLLLYLFLTENILKDFYHFFFVIAALIIIYGLNIQVENKTFTLTNQYANYQIVKEPNGKILMINDAPSSLSDPERKGFTYIENIKQILFHQLNFRNRDILVLGAGGFTLSAENTYQNHFTYVDIDAKIKKIAQDNFGYADDHLVVDDARHFVANTSQSFDAIVVDAYSDVKLVAAHLLTKEYMTTILNRLKPEGVAIFNIIANPMLTDHYSKRVDNTIRAIFHNCMVMPQIYKNQPTNILYICSNVMQNDHKIYSDNFNNSTTDSFVW